MLAATDPLARLEQARRLLADAGLDARVERQIVDIAATPDAVETADVVVLHRVVCCYPDMPGLVGAAADKTRRRLALSFPRETWWIRAGGGVLNLWARLTRKEFRFFVHAPAAIVAVAREHGLRLSREERGRIWHVAAFDRA